MRREDLERYMQTWRAKLWGMVSRAVVRSVDDSGPIKTAVVQVGNKEERTVEVQQFYGFSSNPPKGANGTALFHGGAREHGVLTTSESPADRPKNLSEGEVAIYHDEGHLFHFKNGGELDVSAPTKLTLRVGNTKLTIQEGSIEFDG